MSSPPRTPSTLDLGERLRASRWGLMLALLTVLFGFALGGVFGAAEDSLRAGFQARGEAVLDAVYGGDTARLKAVLDKSWAYSKRAHLHGGAMGVAALAAVALLTALGRPSARVRGAISLALGLGAFGYSSFWLLAARAAPALGGGDLAKESLSWLAIPSAGLSMVGLTAVLVLTALELFAAPEAAREPAPPANAEGGEGRDLAPGGARHAAR